MNILLFESIFSNHFFKTFLMRFICYSHQPPWPCFAKQLVSPTYSRQNFYALCLTVLTSTHLPPYTAWIWQWMMFRRIFSTVKNSITAHCLNCTSSQRSILTGTKQVLWIAVGSRLRMVEMRHHVTARNQCYPVFIILIKNMTKKAKTFQTILLQVCAASPLVICGVLSFDRLVRTVSAPNFTINWRNIWLKLLKYWKSFLKSRK